MSIISMLYLYNIFASVPSSRSARTKAPWGRGLKSPRKKKIDARGVDIFSNEKLRPLESGAADRSIRGKRRLTRSTTPCNRYTFFPLWSTWEGLFTSRQELAARVAAVVAAGVREMPFYGCRSFCRCDERIEEWRRLPLHLVILIRVDSCTKRIALIFKRPRIGRMTTVQRYLHCCAVISILAPFPFSKGEYTRYDPI